MSLQWTLVILCNLWYILHRCFRHGILRACHVLQRSLAKNKLKWKQTNAFPYNVFKYTHLHDQIDALVCARVDIKIKLHYDQNNSILNIRLILFHIHIYMYCIYIEHEIYINHQKFKNKNTVLVIGWKRDILRNT